MGWRRHVAMAFLMTVACADLVVDASRTGEPADASLGGRLDAAFGAGGSSGSDATTREEAAAGGQPSRPEAGAPCCFDFEAEIAVDYTCIPIGPCLFTYATTTIQGCRARDGSCGGLVPASLLMPSDLQGKCASAADVAESRVVRDPFPRVGSSTADSIRSWPTRERCGDASTDAATRAVRDASVWDVRDDARPSDAG